MDFATLRRANLSRCNRWHKDGIDSWSESDWAVALGGEVGELLNKIKKLNRLRDELPNRDNSAPWKDNRDRDTIVAECAEEIADIQLYLDLLAQRLGIDLESAVIQKFNKVSQNNGFPERL